MAVRQQRVIGQRGGKLPVVERISRLRFPTAEQTCPSRFMTGKARFPGEG